MSRRRRSSLPTREIGTIVTLLLAMVGIILLKGRCGQGVGNLFNAIDIPVTDAIRDGGVGRD